MFGWERVSILPDASLHWLTPLWLMLLYSSWEVYRECSADAPIYWLTPLWLKLLCSKWLLKWCQLDTNRLQLEKVDSFSHQIGRTKHFTSKAFDCYPPPKFSKLPSVMQTVFFSSPRSRHVCTKPFYLNGMLPVPYFLLLPIMATSSINAMLSKTSLDTPIRIVSWKNSRIWKVSRIR